MKTNFKPIFKTKLKQHEFRRSFFALSLIFVLMFSVLSATSVFMANAAGPVYVATETELRAAVNNAVEPTLIVFTADIQLTSTTLTIASGKDITLTSSGTGFFKLIGAPGTNTTTINTGGTLELAGIIVTHNSGDIGRGVYVNFSATLILSSGEISGNNVDTSIHSDATNGGGVYNWGTFIMNGGTVSKNSAYNGGGVYNIGTFIMNDGLFSENSASGAGGGVDNSGTFEMNSGTFYRNMAVDGGGVINSVFSTFTLNNGNFLENQVTHGAGGGIYNRLLA